MNKQKLFKMNEKIKLSCPMCKSEFITTRRDKIWCSRDCSSRFRDIKNDVEINYSKHRLIKGGYFNYNFNLDKFSLKGFKGFIPKKEC